MMLTAANLSMSNLRACDTVALGAALAVLREFGYSIKEFIAARPELWRPEIPAAPFRDFLISGF